ncbi:hypothetical protein FXO38_09642 [Capsicum annuum]|nr:hypothetical protein FXO37_11648 [Capsicum annuum]KAF3665313.1 hypothetical protein FXO38_09642 [Capsicum annuum]
MLTKHFLCIPLNNIKNFDSQSFSKRNFNLQSISPDQEPDGFLLSPAHGGQWTRLRSSISQPMRDSHITVLTPLLSPKGMSLLLERFAVFSPTRLGGIFQKHGIEGVVPLELLPTEVRAKYQAKPSERTKRIKKEETKNSAQQAEENQVPENELNLMFPVYISFPIATPPSEIDNEVSRADLEASAAPMETDAGIATVNISQDETPTPEDNPKQSSDTDVAQEAGQTEADTEAETGLIDGETDAEVDLDAVG